METVSRMHPDEDLTADRRAEVVAFLDTLKKEQAKFLDSVRGACSLLGREPGQLAHVAATHSRLTQQFFDAQRLIMTRRAEFDAEVAAIGRAAERNAVGCVAAARSQVDSGGTFNGLPLAHPAVAHAALRYDDVARRSARHEAAALGASVVRTMEAAESLAPVIDDAFEPVEPDGRSLQRQLATLLDDWWRTENQEGRAMVDLAEARAAMRAHVAQVEAGEVLATARRRVDGRVELTPSVAKPMHSESAQRLSPQVSAILDQADSISLDSLLGMLAESLEVPLKSFAPPRGPRVEFAPVTIDPPAVATPAKDIGTEDAFRDFWSAGSVPVGPRRSFQWPKASAPAVARPTLHDGR